MLVVLLLAGLGVGGYFVYTEFIQPSLASGEEKEEADDSKGDKDKGNEADDDDSGDSSKDDEDDDYTISRPDKTDSDDKDTDSEKEATAPNATQPYIPEPVGTDPPGTEPLATEPNPYESYILDQTDYILPGSQTGYLNYDHVSSLSVVELTIAKQEIYARHGAKAQDQDLQAYFESRSWYQESNYTYSLNSYEEKNLILLDTFLLQKNGGASQSGNRYLMLYTDSSGYVIPGSNSRYLYASDARNLSEDALYVAYYEIYARRGCMFDDSALQAYFYTKSWYTPSVRQSDFYDSSLNKYETNNLVLIRAYEKKAKKVPVGEGTEYYNEYQVYGNQDYIFSDSSYRYMSERELWGMSADELELARNEIYARHGYLFSDQALRDYFCTKEWYYPDTVMGDQASLGFSDVELANIRLMRDYENLVE